MAWTKQDQKRAQRQGWMLVSASFLGDTDYIAIQRLDDPQSAGLRYKVPRFTDAQAEAYVRGRAEAGCNLAKKALRESDHVFRSVGRISDWNQLGPSRKHKEIA